jgi:transposase
VGIWNLFRSIIFQKKVDPKWFHDNRLGNALDALNNVGLNSMYSAIISKAIIKYSVELSKLHFDTTSISLYGKYETDEENPLVTYGHSKLHRPDLKQVLFGLTVTQQFPLLQKTYAGNKPFIIPFVNIIYYVC